MEFSSRSGALHMRVEWKEGSCGGRGGGSGDNDISGSARLLSPRGSGRPTSPKAAGWADRGGAHSFFFVFLGSVVRGLPLQRNQQATTDAELAGNATLAWFHPGPDLFCRALPADPAGVDDSARGSAQQRSDRRTQGDFRIAKRAPPPTERRGPRPDRPSKEETTTTEPQPTDIL